VAKIQNLKNHGKEDKISHNSCPSLLNIRKGIKKNLSVARTTRAAETTSNNGTNND